MKIREMILVALTAVKTRLTRPQPIDWFGELAEDVEVARALAAVQRAS